MNELIASVENSAPDALAGLIVAVTGAFAAVAAVAFIRYLMTAIGYSKMYRKAGEAGWKAFIPVFNTYTRRRRSANSR